MGLTKTLDPSSLPDTGTGVSANTTESVRGVLYKAFEFPQSHVIGNVHEYLIESALRVSQVFQYTAEFEEDPPPVRMLAGVSHEFRPMPHMFMVSEFISNHAGSVTRVLEFAVPLTASDFAGIVFEYLSIDSVGRVHRFSVNPEIGKVASTAQFIVPNNLSAGRVYGSRLPDNIGISWAFSFAIPSALRTSLAHEFAYNAPLLTVGQTFENSVTTLLTVGQTFEIDIDNSAVVGQSYQFIYNTFSQSVQRSFEIITNTKQTAFGVQQFTYGQAFDAIGVDFEITLESKINTGLSHQFTYNEPFSRVGVPFQFEIDFTLLPQIGRTFALVTATRELLGANFEYMYSATYPVAAAFEIAPNLSARPLVARTFEYLYSGTYLVSSGLQFNVEFVEQISQSFRMDYDLLGRDTVASVYRAAYALQPEVSETEEVDWAAYDKEGNELSALSFNLKIDEGDFAWSGSIELSEFADYEALRRGDEISIVAGGETYSLVVDGKSKSIDAPAQLSMTILVVSPTARYDFPQAQPVTKTWDQDVYAYAAASEHIDVPLDWQIVNWIIPGFRLGVDNVSPIKVVSLLAQAVNGTVETTREGELYVRPLYYHSTEFFYEDLLPHYELDDTRHVFTLRENYSSERIANRIRIRDVQFTYADSLEWVLDKNSQVSGDLKAFPSPYRVFEMAPVITTAMSDVVQLLPIEEVEEEIEEAELVEIYEGQGRTRYPIYEITDVVWESEPLSGFAFDVGSSNIRTTDPDRMYALLRLKYKTRYHLYRVTGTLDRAAQFLMLDLTEE